MGGSSRLELDREVMSTDWLNLHRGPCRANGPVVPGDAPDVPVTHPVRVDPAEGLFRQAGPTPGL